MLIRGASEKRDEIDQQISAHASGWSFDRLAAVDRNILRLAAYELLYVAEITAGIAINEAVELAMARPLPAPSAQRSLSEF
jgi:N utilization substance protein B